MNKNNRPLLITAAALVAVVLVGLIAFLVNRAQAPGPAAAAVVRAGSQVLDDAGTDAVTVVEFLDFECEACGAYYPVVEELRQKYAGQITYVVRYFPLPGHFNSTHSAVAAEAAAPQGRFEEMYQRLFETQAEWGEAQESKADAFRSYAAELGLDLTAYDAAVAVPESERRVLADFNEGRALGVGSTPNFFHERAATRHRTLERPRGSYPSRPVTRASKVAQNRSVCTTRSRDTGRHRMSRTRTSSWPTALRSGVEGQC